MRVVPSHLIQSCVSPFPELGDLHFGPHSSAFSFQSLAISTRTFRAGNGATTRPGSSSYVRPLSSRPALDLWTPPHCLKKKCTSEALQRRRMRSTQDFSIGRAPWPLSPPTIEIG